MNILANGKTSFSGEWKGFQKRVEDDTKFKANVNQLSPTEMASGQ